MTADEVHQRGVLRAPFGEIDINAQKLTLEKGSVTSTSGAGLSIPFGTIQAGEDWTYLPPGGQTQVFTENGPPAQRVRPTADALDVQSGAVVDVSGGGELLGYEFVPGVTGTRDILANSFAPEQFAIVPAAWRRVRAV